MARLRIVTLGIVGLLAAACGPGTPTTAPTATQAAVATTVPPAAPCAAASLNTLNAGVLTTGTSEPAYPPYFEIEDPAPSGSIWTLGQPPNGQGLESATAYAIATKLGFT